MTAHHLRYSSWAVALAIATGGQCARADDKPDPSIAEVQAVLKKQVDDWNRGDLDAFLGGYWKSPRVVFQSGGNRSQGWDAMRDRYRKRYQTEGKVMGRLEFKGLEIEPLGPDAAMARGSWHLTMPDGTTPNGLFTVILRRLPDGWKIIHDHTSSADTAQPAPKAPPARNSNL